MRGDLQSLRLMVDSIPGLVYTTTPKGKLELVNRRIVEYYGKTAEQLKDWPTPDCVHPDDLPRVRESWRQAVEYGELQEVEQRLRRADGVYRWFRTRAYSLRDREGRIVRWCGLLTDIDDQKRAEMALMEMQTRLSRAAQVATGGELAASIAHEVNQPLTAVSANGSACLRWLSCDPPDLDRARQAAECVVRDAHAAGEVVRRIRALFKRGRLEKRPLNLTDVIGDVLRLIENQVSKRGVVVETDLAADLPSVVGDHVQLQQVMLNLMLNGIEAMDTVTDRARTLVVRTRRGDDGNVLLEVRDQGTGISEPGRAFEAFFTTKEEGMGMGLAICRSIVEEHNGRICVVPTDGPGTTFRVTLPTRS